MTGQPANALRTFEEFAGGLAEPLGALLTAVGAAAVSIGARLSGSSGIPEDRDLAAATARTGHLAGYVCASSPGIGGPAPGRPRGEYLLAFDPLDAPGNAEVNAAAGTIFSILRSPRPGEPPAAADFLRPGTAQVAAGFALYGPATVLVLTTGAGVDMFTLDRADGRLRLTHPNLRMPAPGPETPLRGTGSPAADAFRILRRGGVCRYPGDTGQPQPDGPVHLLCQAGPLAYLIEQAGGAAGTGRGRILDVVPATPHDRTPLIFGSAAEVARAGAAHPPEAGFDASLFNVRSLFRVP